MEKYIENKLREAIPKIDLSVVGEYEYEYLGDFSATPPWHSRGMSCSECRVSWTGCWDESLCPKCGMGDLPGSEGTIMTLAELKAIHNQTL